MSEEKITMTDEKASEALESGYEMHSLFMPKCYYIYEVLGRHGDLKTHVHWSEQRPKTCSNCRDNC